MKKAYLHESIINRSESRLFLTTSPGRKTTLIRAELFWRGDASSREEALSKLRWHCERYGYQLIESAAE